MDNLKVLIIELAIIVGVFSAGLVMAQPDYSRPLPEENGFRKPPVQRDVMLREKQHLPFGEFRGQDAHRQPSREDFEARLNLTQEQKDIAKAQREKSIEKIKPIIEQINAKKVEIEAVQKTKMAPKAIDERVAQLENEIRILRKQAHDIRRENMKAFEASLTDVQKKEMLKMKEEGRKRFEEAHKQHK